MMVAPASNVAVIIPTYNGSRYIDDALRSVFAQSFLPGEVVVVDDRSTDETVELVRASAQGSPVPVRTIVLDRNSGGPARPINVGVGATAAPLISVLDQDDVFLPRELECRAAALSKCPTAVVAFSWCGCFHHRGRYLQGAPQRQAVEASASASPSCVEIGGDSMLRLLIERGNFIWGYPGFMFRREAWVAKGGIDETLRIASDYDFLSWLARQGSAVLLNEIGYLRREHEANMSRCQTLMYREMDVVRMHAIGKVRDQRSAGQLRDGARRHALATAFQLREEGHYRDSFAHLRLLLAQPGGRAAALAAIAKLVPHWAVAACRGMRRRGPDALPSGKKSYNGRQARP